MIKLSLFFKENLLGIVVVGVFCSLLASYLYAWFISDPEPQSQPEILQRSSSLNPTPGADIHAPALKVRFADGQSALVSFSYQVALAPGLAPEIISKYGNQESATSDLSNSVEGAVFNVLESRTLSEVREHRADIAEQIIILTRGAQERTGHKIEEFRFHKIQ